MFESFSHVLKILTDKAVRWTYKMFYVIVILTALWFINDRFDFVNSFRTNNKLQQLEKISALLKDTTLTKNQRDDLLLTRQSIIDRQTPIDYFFSFLTLLPEKINRKTPTKINNHNISAAESANDENKSVIKNYWLHYLFSNTFLLLLMLSIPYFAFRDNQKQTATVLIIATLIMWAGLFFIGMIIAWLFDFIPVIIGRPWVNYIIDFILQSVLAGFVVQMVTFLQKKNKPAANRVDGPATCR